MEDLTPEPIAVPAGDGAAVPPPAPPAGMPPEPPPRAPELLARTRAEVEPALRQAVDRLPPPVARVARYHFGWGTADGRPLPPAEGSWGKGLRSALVLACAEAVGGDRVQAVPAAVAVELVHNASLLHDDIIDGDALRRHRPAVWAAFDVATAVLTGDALFFLAVQVLTADLPRAAAARAVPTLLDSVQHLIEGELADHAYEHRSQVTVDQALQVAAGKTGALMRDACRLGACCGGGDDEQVLRLGRFGGECGIAFQLADDIAGIRDGADRTGKPAGSDLRNGKKTIPIITALNAPTGAPAGSADLSADRLAALVHDTGALQATEHLTRLHLRQARDHLRSARPAPAAHHALLALLDLLGRPIRHTAC
ncbi:polyprenyl synthetase family protein [Spirillospora sp. NPDC050679]